MTAHCTTRLEDVRVVASGDADYPDWQPLRRDLGVTAFGLQAWTARAGQRAIEAHDEADSGHEEVYICIAGRARFSVGDESSEVGPGAVVFVSDPTARREARALEDDTRFVTIGAKPGAAFTPSEWEDRFLAKSEG